MSRRGVVRGIHYADVPPGQAKYVTCLAGRVLDTEARRAVFLAEGLGHAFMALSDEATVTYLCSTPDAPAREHGISPVDPRLALPWPADIPPLLSPKDAEAPTLDAAAEQGLLPEYEQCRMWYGQRQVPRPEFRPAVRAVSGHQSVGAHQDAAW